VLDYYATTKKGQQLEEVLCFCSLGDAVNSVPLDAGCCVQVAVARL
jgi:hypothetical protein